MEDEYIDYERFFTNISEFWVNFFIEHNRAVIYVR